jgi:indole-3-glycerol phosphate synthase
MKIRRQQPSTPVPVENLEYQVKVPDGEPNNILEKIVWYKEQEVQKRRESLPLVELRKQVSLLTNQPLDFVGALLQSKNQPALIAEVKKASPSKGIIKADFDPVAIAQAYQEGGAACLSVLTDSKFFQGSFENLAKVRATVNIPLLCKEFILYPYQIYLARLNGADAVLLIAAILKDIDIEYFLKIIHNLGMTALIEVHTIEEFDRVLKIEGVKLVGINNRNLENFTVDLDNTKNILSARQEELSRKEITIVSESGLYTKADLDFVESAGAKAVLIGESIVKQDDLKLAIHHLYH